MSRGPRIAGLTALGLLMFPALAAAQTLTLATTDLNMRSGPGPSYAVVGVIPGYHQAVVHGCTPDRTWCEVSYGPLTGWSHSRYLAVDSALPAAAAPAPVIAVAGPPADDPGHTAAPLVGAAGGALAGGLIAGPLGIAIGGVTGALLTAPR